MATCAETLAKTLRDLGITRMFGLPGGEILPFLEAARQVGIEFILTRDEATASFMADVTGQATRQPGVCVATLGPGAVNLIQGVVNAYLDRSPMIALTASTPLADAPYVTHQKLDLNAVYRPFTKAAITLNGENTGYKVREVYRHAVEPRMGPVHIALPSDIATQPERQTIDPQDCGVEPIEVPLPARDALVAASEEIRRAKRPILVLGLDLDPHAIVGQVRELVEALGVPTFATPKAKGILPEDHPLFCGVCAGVSGDAVVMELFAHADLLVGVGFDQVESDKLWHRSMKLLSLNEVTIADAEYEPYMECVGDLRSSLPAISASAGGNSEWPPETCDRFRRALHDTLSPQEPPRRGLSPYELTRALRDAYPSDTILCTDVGSIKSVTSQAWATIEPLSFFESNGLSSMGYGFPAAMAMKLLFPERPVLCTMGDGGFAMTLTELETCVRHGINFLTVVYNDSTLSLIQVAQERRRFPNFGVEFGNVDFAAVAAGFGAWSRKVDAMEDLHDLVLEAQAVNRPAVLDVTVDPTEYRAHEGLVKAELQILP